MSFRKPDMAKTSQRTVFAKSNFEKPASKRTASSGVRRMNNTRPIASAHPSLSNNRPTSSYRPVINSNVYRMAYVALDVLREGDTYVKINKLENSLKNF